MLNERQYFMLSSTMIIIGFVVLFFLFQTADVETGNFALTGNIIGNNPVCNDGTELNNCSGNYFGNSCQITRAGPRLIFDSKCYE